MEESGAQRWTTVLCILCFVTKPCVMLFFAASVNIKRAEANSVLQERTNTSGTLLETAHGLCHERLSIFCQ